MKFKNRYLYYSILPCCLLLIVIGIYVSGYNPPTQDPPYGNLPAPINAGLDPQTKTGNLTIDGLLKIGRYTSAPTGSTGALYYDTTENAFKGYKASSWDSLGGIVPVSSVFGRTGAIVATTGDYTVSKITGAAPLASPTFTGTVTAPTLTTAGFKMTTGAGTNKVLTSDASGVASWKTPAGGTLSCHKVIASGVSDVTATCDYGICTGGGCFFMSVLQGTGNLSDYLVGNGWRCYTTYNTNVTAYAVCCEIL